MYALSDGGGKVECLFSFSDAVFLTAGHLRVRQGEKGT